MRVINDDIETFVLCQDFGVVPTIQIFDSGCVSKGQAVTRQSDMHGPEEKLG